MKLQITYFSAAIILMIGFSLVGVCFWARNNESGRPVSLSFGENRISGEQGGANNTAAKSRRRTEMAQSIEPRRNGKLNNLSVALNDYLALLENADEASLPGLFKQISQFKGDEKEFALNMLSRRWAFINPMGAARFSQTIEDSVVCGRFMDGVLRRWPRDALSEGFNWIAQIQNSSMQDHFWTALIGRAIMLDPVLASDYIERVQDNRSKLGLISELAAAWASSDIAAALNWAQTSLSDQSKTMALVAIGSELAKRDPLQAAALLEKIPFGSPRTELLGKVAENLFSLDAEAGKNWLFGLDDADQKKAMIACSSHWAKSNPEEAANFGAELTGLPQEEFLTKVFRVWGLTDPAAAVTWAQDSGKNLPLDSLQELFNSWASSNLQEAAGHIQNVRDDVLRTRLLKSVAVEWALTDPQAAAEFAVALPDAQQRLEAVSKVARVWAGQDSIEASRWIAALEVGPVRDRGVAQLALAIVDQDPESAFNWTLEISDPNERLRWIKANGKLWIEDGGEAAVSKIKTLGLSQGERKALGIK